MQPSSLIFLVIIGVWAAFFLQYWMRRRELIATARSVDEFTETMRVLQVREPAPHLDLAGPPPRSYAVSPARAARPQILVKHAQTQTHQFADDTRASVASPISGGASVTSTPNQPVDAQPTPADLVMSPSRTLRGLTLLVGLAGFVLFLILAAFGVLRWIAPLVPLAIAVGGFAWLRAGVQAEIRARRSLRAHTRARERGPLRTPSARRTSASSGGRAPGSAGRAPASANGGALAGTEQVSAVVDTPLFDHSPVPQAAPATVAPEAPAAVPVVAEESVPNLPEVDEDDIPLTWEPRPVPTPTYALKARIEQRPIAPGTRGEQATGRSTDAELSYPERVRRAVND